MPQLCAEQQEPRPSGNTSPAFPAAGDARQKPIFYNAEAERILNFSLNGRAERAGKDGVAAAVRAILSRRNNAVAGSSTGVPEILSGRGRYYWQTFSVFEKTGKRSPKITAVLIEVSPAHRKRVETPNLAQEFPLDRSRGGNRIAFEAGTDQQGNRGTDASKPKHGESLLAKHHEQNVGLHALGNPGKGAAVLYDQRPGSPRAYCMFLENGNTYALHLIAVLF